ncbi:alcohol dehydrogenase catalytic domain-containing protein [Pseudonocardia sp. CA-107938]|uniref:alcohol dehydrogenase catalytic domain-containing protein n=1 Tax=Pseudonocardia sp. CA-107938 TaxID=3240021 RepID=UPI003D94FF10
MMRAARWYGRGDVRVEETPDPGEPARGEAILRVRRVGLCGSDRREFLAGPVLIPGEPHPLTGRCAPVTLGHEIVGEAVSVGESRDTELLGHRFAVDPTISCGRCRACRRREGNLCSTAACLGVSADGGLATFVTVRVSNLVPVPDSVPDEHAVLAEPLSVALHAMDRAGLRPGERVLVSGFGPIGAGVVLAARASGAADVIVLEPDPERRSRAADAGARPFPPSAARRELRSFADVGFECSGAPGALESVLRVVRPGGRVVVPAINADPAVLDLRRLVLSERAVLGSIGYRGDVARAVSMLASGVLDPSVLAGPTIGLDAVPGWFADPGPTAPMKVLVAP